jgi:hypothetical protein
MRNSDEDKEAAEFLDDDDDFDLSPNEEYLHSIKVHSFVYSFMISINKFFFF